MNSRFRPDHFTRKARKTGYPARSVFKLEEMHKKWNLMKKGKPVLDVGSAPGSWTLFALRTLGKGSQVTSLDIKPLNIKAPPETELRFFQGDVFSPESAEFLAEGGAYGCILSDAAPSTSGNRLVDTQKSCNLVMRVLDLADVHLAHGGNFVAKIFQGGDEHNVRARMKTMFQKTKAFKPEAVRSASMEIYIIGMGYLI